LRKYPLLVKFIFLFGILISSLCLANPNEAGKTFMALAAANNPSVGMSHVVLAHRSKDKTTVAKNKIKSQENYHFFLTFFSAYFVKLKLFF